LTDVGLERFLGLGEGKIGTVTRIGGKEGGWTSTTLWPTSSGVPNSAGARTASAASGRRGS
jgi:hypothetical protein